MLLMLYQFYGFRPQGGKTGTSQRTTGMKGENWK